MHNYISQFHPEFLDNFTIENISSAVKFFRILENNADLYLHFRRSMEWDTASGQAMAELMGGKVKNLFSNDDKYEIGGEMMYKKTDFANRPFILSLNKL